MSHAKKSFLAFTRAIAALTPKCTPKPPPPPLPQPYSLNIDSYLEPIPNNVYSQNRVISNLIKSGLLDFARELFDKMLERDVVTWNTLISGYGRFGFSTDALYLYDQNGLSRVIVLGLTVNAYVVSALVDLYMNMGFVNLALRLFYDLPERNVEVWNLLLRRFSDLGGSDELFGLHYVMKKEGVLPNPLTFCYLIRECGDFRHVDEGKKLHCSAIKVGWSESNLFVANALVDFYSALGRLNDAKRSFEVIPTEDVISWNSLISVYSSNGFAIDAVEVFAKMQLWGKKPSIQSFVGLLNLSSRGENLLLGKQVHCFVMKSGFDFGSIHVQSALIDMYGKCAQIDRSVSIFVNIPLRTRETCNSLMTSFMRCGIVEDVVELFGLMVDDHIGFGEVSLSTSLKALSVSSSACLPSCTSLHCCAVKSGFECDLAVSCSLIDAYSRFGLVNYSRQVFKQLPFTNVVPWTSIINGHARNGMGIECLELLKSIIQTGLRPDEVTFLCVLSGCNHSGLVEEERMVFELMKTLHGINPDRQHFSCMVDLLGHVGLLDEAEELLKQTPAKDDSVLWSSLFRSCRVQQNERVGRRVAKILMDLEPENPSVWLHVSNFYSEIREFKISMQIREVAMARKMQRDIGYSFIEVDGHF